MRDQTAASLVAVAALATCATPAAEAVTAEVPALAVLAADALVLEAPAPTATASKEAPAIRHQAVPSQAAEPIESAGNIAPSVTRQQAIEGAGQITVETSQEKAQPWPSEPGDDSAAPKPRRR